MVAKTGLLIVSNPMRVAKILTTINEKVKTTLYIHLPNPTTTTNCFYHDSINNQQTKPSITPKYYQTVRILYAKVAELCGDLDVRILLSTLKYSTVTSLKTSQPIDLIIFDKKHEKTYIDHILNNYVLNKETTCSVLTLNDCDSICDDTSEKQESIPEMKLYKHSVAGGTFDRLHIGHKLLLTACVLGAREKVTIGVTDINMLNSKILWEMIVPINIRLENVQTFLTDICPELDYNIVVIKDMYGPTSTDPDMDLLVVSEETLRGGHKINQQRIQNGLNPLEIITIPLLDDTNGSDEASNETKISSSTERMRLLGTLLKPVNRTESVEPYVIGLTGTIASGKSAIAGHLSRLGAAVVNCDLVAHQLYRKDEPLFKLVVETFGDSILDEEGEINRKILGSIVFNDKEKLQQLNNLAWPAIANEVKRQLPVLYESGHKVVVIEAAVLLQAGWNRSIKCNEIWLCIVPTDEAVARLRNRNGLTESEANARLAAQPSNEMQIPEAHVILCTLWSTDYTKRIVERAWSLLTERLPVQR